MAGLHHDIATRFSPNLSSRPVFIGQKLWKACGGLHHNLTTVLNLIFILTPSVIEQESWRARGGLSKVTPTTVQLTLEVIQGWTFPNGSSLMDEATDMDI